jgi:HEAT repeat protein
MVRALEDESFGVRWLAAEGLIAMGQAGIPSLLRALMVRSDSPWLRAGAHHVLRSLAENPLHQYLAPVLAALDDVEPTLAVPIAAHDALYELKQKDSMGIPAAPAVSLN